MTRSESAKLVACLLAAFPSTRATTATSEVYERMLADLDYLVANAAVERLLATSRFMPSISEIRGACLDLTHGTMRAGGEAWGDMLKAVSRWGSYRTPGADFQFQDPLVAKCVASMGWSNLCLSENQVADRSRFIALYDELAKHEGVNRNVAQLPSAKAAKALQEGNDATQTVAFLAKRLARPA